jgi:hypothetical protein
MKQEAKKLIQMVRKELPDKEIMEKLGIQTRTSLKKMYYDALVEAGKIKDILTEKEAKRVTTKKRPLRITKRGMIILGRALVIDGFGFREGDKFVASKSKDSIILTKVGE